MLHSGAAGNQSGPDDRAQTRLIRASTRTDCCCNPLPYRNSERLAIIWTHSPGANVAQDWPSPGQFSALKSDNTVFEELALAQGSNVIVTGQATPERYGVVRASSAVFSLLGARAELGRVFLSEEDAPGMPLTVIEKEMAIRTARCE